MMSSGRCGLLVFSCCKNSMVPYMASERAKGWKEGEAANKVVYKQAADIFHGKWSTIATAQGCILSYKKFFT